MRINAVRIESYKGFNDTGWVELGENFTVLVGQNNAGKSAFLSAFNAPENIRAEPHRDPLKPAGISEKDSRISFRVSVKGDEIDRYVQKHENVTMNVNVADPNEFYITLTSGDQSHEITLHSNGVESNAYPNYGFFDNAVSNWCLYRLNKQTGRVEFSGGSGPNAFGLKELLKFGMKESIFVFSPERYKVGRCGMNLGDRLAANGSNLPYLLFALQKNPVSDTLFRRLVHEILPGIKRVVVAPNGLEVEISIHNHISLRPDLAVSLNDSGTGVAQVLCILYVLVA